MKKFSKRNFKVNHHLRFQSQIVCIYYCVRSFKRNKNNDRSMMTMCLLTRIIEWIERQREGETQKMRHTFKYFTSCQLFESFFKSSTYRHFLDLSFNLFKFFWLELVRLCWWIYPISINIWDWSIFDCFGMKNAIELYNI